MSLKLTTSSHGYVGEIQHGEGRYPLTARRDGEALSGSFESQGHSYEFTAALQDDSLHLTTDKATHDLTRGKPPANPLGLDNQAASVEHQVTEEKPEPAAKPTATSWTTFRHPAGFRVDHPTNWQAHETNEGLILVPSDQATSPQGPREVFLLGALPLDSGVRLDNPAGLRVLDQSIRSAFPRLEAASKHDTLDLGGHEVVVITWEGTSPAGKPIRGRMFLRQVKDWAVSLLVVAEADLLEPREPVVRQIIARIGFQEAPRDTALVGQWRHTDTYMSGEFSMITERYLLLRADGACFEGSRMIGGMSHSDGSGSSTGSSHLDSGESGWDYRGRWSNTGSRLTMTWENANAETWNYYVEGASLLLKPPGGGKNKLYKRTR